MVKTLSDFKSKITIFNGEKSCDGKALFALLKLRVKKDGAIRITAEGEDEEAAIATAESFLKENL